MKPVGKPDALIGHVRFDERGWETGRRSGVSTRAHPRLYKLATMGPEVALVGNVLGPAAMHSGYSWHTPIIRLSLR